MDLSAAGAWMGAANGVLLFCIASVRKRRIDYAGVAPAGAVFIASYNICPPFYLFYFVANAETRKLLPSDLSGYDKYMGFAAICSLLVTLVALVSFYRKAWERR